ncbi:MAG: ACP S-malonyltransferase [Pseudomonadota bacterium]
MTNAFLFPGQGAQTIGMGRDLAEAYPAAKDVFSTVDDALNEKLSALIWDGEIETLTLTQNAQPALMAMSMAVVAALEVEGITIEAASFVAGHSLGEYSALCAAKSLTVSDTAKLLRLRGEAMQAAVPVGEGAMAAILGLDFEAVSLIAREAARGGQVCQAANDNDPGQVVISGTKAAVELAAEIAKERGAKRAMLLPVSAPFHCKLMQPAQDKMQEALSDATILDPIVPVVQNVSAHAVSDAASIRQNLVNQVTGSVRWRESIDWMASQGVTATFEIGAGKALSGMVRRIVKDVSVNAVGDAAGVAAARDIMKG